MNINDLTLGQIKEIQSLRLASNNDGISSLIGKDVIIRTFSAGVWFGRLAEKSGNEVILCEARRMWKWWAAQSISLSAVSMHGIINEKSKIVEPVSRVWLEAIEIIPCTQKAIDSIKGADYVKAE